MHFTYCALSALRRCARLAPALLIVVATVVAPARADNPFETKPLAQSNFEFRVWTDDDGKNRVEARFVSATTTHVKLLKRDGALVDVPLKKLSAADRGFAQGAAVALAIVKKQKLAAEAKVAAELRAAEVRKRTEAAKNAAMAKRKAEEEKKRDEDAKRKAEEAKRAEAERLAMANIKVVKLPDTIGNVSRAAGGKLLLVHLPASRKVAVYDVDKRAITKYISLSSSSAVIVGGLTKMIAVSPNDGVIERWSLKSLEKETTRPLPFDGVFKTMEMGCATDGPLLIVSSVGSSALSRVKYALYDIQSFKPLEIDVRGRNSSYRDAVHIRASATGNVFGMWATSHSPQGMEVLRVLGNKAVNSYQHSSAGHIVPNFDGSAILTGYAGVCTIELNRQDTSRSTKRVPLVPTTHPRFYVGVPAEPGAQINLGREPFKGVSPTLHCLGAGHRLINLPLLRLGKATGNSSWSRGDFTLDRRVHFALSEGQLISVPYSNDRILVQEFNVRKELDKADIDYLYVTSVPTRHVSRGKNFAYEIEVASSHGKPSFELSSGPKGMSVDGKGHVKWRAPEDFAEKEVTVIVTISTPDKQNIYETFRLTCPDAIVKADTPASSSKADSNARPQNEKATPTPRERAPRKKPIDPLEIKIQPEGIFRSLTPNPSFSAGRPTLRKPPAVGLRKSPARARVKVYNRGKRTISRLVLSVNNSFPIVARRTVTVDALRGVGHLSPGAGVELTASWPLLPNVRLGAAAGTISVDVADIAYR